MRIEFLGTGTSQGVPVIGCDCPVCQSKDAKDKRLRCSVLIDTGTETMVVDTGPDFRQQMLRANVNHLDAVLITHEHNDHIIGLDDIRPFNFRSESDMPIHALDRVKKELLHRFGYIFKKDPYPGAPRVILKTIDPQSSFFVGNTEVLPIEVMHGNLPIVGFRIADFTYITDAHTILPTELAKLRGTEILVLNALHLRPHHSHLNLEQALKIILEVNPKKAYLTHISHLMGLHEESKKRLPANVQIAYDGLQLDI